MTTGSRVLQAREIAGLTQDDLASAAGVNQVFISYVERNLRAPSPEVLQAVALRTGFTPAFFRQPAPPGFPEGSLLYRKRKRASSADLARLRQQSRLLFEVVDRLSVRFRDRPIKVPRLQVEPEEAARITRSQLELSPFEPITSVTAALERAGVVFLPFLMNVDDCDGFSLWAQGAKGEVPVIAESGKVPSDRQRFSRAHELGHLVLHFPPRKDVGRLDEEANSFAAHFLLPRESFVAELELPLAFPHLKLMKKRWGVSMQAIVEHAWRLLLITKSQREYFYRRLNAHGWGRREPVSVPREKPRLLSRMCDLLWGNGQGAEEIAEEFGLTVSRAEQFLAVFASSAELASGQEAQRAAFNERPSKAAVLLFDRKTGSNSKG